MKRCSWVTYLLPALLLLLLNGCGKPQPEPLPVIREDVGDVDLLLSSGRKAVFSELRGRVVLAAHYYSVCPMGCSTVADAMSRVRQVLLEKKIPVHCLSLAIDPEDTPARLAGFAKDSFEVKDGEQSWWFATGDQTALRYFLTSGIGFTPVIEKPESARTSPQDKYVHDLRIALIDARGQLRGFYDPSAAKDQDALIRVLAAMAEDVVLLQAESTPGRVE